MPPALESPDPPTVLEPPEGVVPTPSADVFDGTAVDDRSWTAVDLKETPDVLQLSSLPVQSSKTQPIPVTIKPALPLKSSVSGTPSESVTTLEDLSLSSGTVSPPLPGLGPSSRLFVRSGVERNTRIQK